MQRTGFTLLRGVPTTPGTVLEVGNEMTRAIGRQELALDAIQDGRHGLMTAINEGTPEISPQLQPVAEQPERLDPISVSSGTPLRRFWPGSALTCGGLPRLQI